jgi:hypothetical protein
LLKIGYIYFFTALVFFGLTSLTKLNVYETASLTFLAHSLFVMVNNIGQRIAFYDLVIFLSVFGTLAMPVQSFIQFDAGNMYAQTWGRLMPVTAEEYFSFMIPANVALMIGLKLPIYTNIKDQPVRYIHYARQYLANKGNIGYYIILIGLLSSVLKQFIGGGLAYIFYLMANLTFVGLFYLYFSGARKKTLIMVAGLCVSFAQALVSGMFGEFVFFSALGIMIILLEYNKINYSVKLAGLIVGAFLVLLLQSVKGDYRKVIWYGADLAEVDESSNLSTFSSLFKKRLEDPASILDEAVMFSLNARFNQGFLIALTMDYIPSKEPFAGGETILRSLAAVVVPRFLWPDKPTAGGADNLSRFMGIKQKISYSMNIGPFGEAYGNFGRTGGVVFMFGYGLLLNLLLCGLLKLCTRRPSLLLWFPFFFFYSITVETDILTTVNSLVKAAVFAFCIFWAFKRFFKVEI